MATVTFDPEHAFWRAHDRSGVLVAAGGGGLVAGYALLSWDLPGRLWMLVIGVLVLVVVPPLLLLLPDGDGELRRWRTALYYALEVIGIGVVTALVWLDGGLGSPLGVLYLVVLVHGIAVYPTRIAVAMTGLVLVSYLLLALDAGVDAARAGTAAGAILLTAAVAALAARNHISLRQHQSRVQELLRQQARTDGLTGALNRQGMSEALTAHVSALGVTAPVSVLAIDLDAFKALNDTAGHLVGDHVLQRVVAALEGASRAGDVVGRPGGDEFILLLPGADGDVAERVAARIHDELERDEVPITVSIGIATATGPQEARTLLARADEALYAAKRAGRGRTRRALAPA